MPKVVSGVPLVLYRATVNVLRVLVFDGSATPVTKILPSVGSIPTHSAMLRELEPKGMSTWPPLPNVVSSVPFVLRRTNIQSK